MKKPLLIGGVVAALLVIIWGGYELVSSRRAGELRLFGNVDIRSVDLGFRVPGRIASIAVDEGSHVRAGTVLAQLDAQPLTDALNVASAALTKAHNGSRPQDISQAEQLVADRTATLAQAKAEYERRGELVATGAVSQAVYDASRAQFLAAQAQLKAAEQALALQRLGPRREDIEALEAQHTLAVAERDKARTDLNDATILAPAIPDRRG
jgi:HlyD family secretion protein